MSLTLQQKNRQILVKLSVLIEKSYWAMNTGNKTIEEGYENYVYERV